MIRAASAGALVSASAGDGQYAHAVAKPRYKHHSMPESSDVAYNSTLDAHKPRPELRAARKPLSL